MNLPNKLTCLRVLLIPVFLIFLYIGNFSFRNRYLDLQILYTDQLGNRNSRHNILTGFYIFF